MLEYISAQEVKMKYEEYLWEHGTLGVAATDTVQAVNIAISIKGIIKEELIHTLLRKQKIFTPLLKKTKMDLIK